MKFHKAKCICTGCGKCAIRAYCLRGTFAQKGLVAVLGQNLSLLWQNKANSVWDQKEFCVRFLHLFPITLASWKASIGMLYID